MKYLRIGTTLLLVTLVCASLDVNTRGQVRARADQAIDLASLYRAIINIEFPQPSPPPQGYLLLTTLRFFPAAGTESQINVTQDNEGRFTVVRYSLPRGSRSIDEQLGDLYYAAKLGDETSTEEIARRFKVDTRTIKVESNILTDLFNQLGELHFPSIVLKPSKNSVAPEGNDYNLWYTTTLGELHFRYIDSGYKEEFGKARGLTEWMNHVRKIVETADH